MKHITVSAFKEVIEAEGNNKTIDFINVCTPAEYNEKHIEGVRNVPLSEIEKHAKSFEDKRTIYVHCRSGGRSAMAIQTLTNLGLQAELVNVEGGILAWDEAGHPTYSHVKRTIPIIRQVLITASSLSFIGFALMYTVHPNFIYLPILVSAGLFFAGITGKCSMTTILSRMPWNK